jgi:hypothetical protein
VSINVIFFGKNTIDTQKFNITNIPNDPRCILPPNETLNFDRNIALSNYLIEESAMRQTLRPDATVLISIGSVSWNEKAIPQYAPQ